MGNLQAEISKNVSNEFNSVVTNVIANAVNSFTFGASAVNTIKLSTCPTFMGQNLTINQIAGINTQLTVKNTQDLSVTIKNNLSAAISNWIQQSAGSTQEWLSFALNGQISSSEVVNNISNQITNTITSNVSNTCMTQAYTDNNLTIELCGTITNTEITQNAQLTAMISCITKQTQTILVGNSAIAQAINRTDQYFYSQQQGLGGILNYIIIGAVIIFIILVIAAVYSHSSSQNVKAQRAAQQQQEDALLSMDTSSFDTFGDVNGLNNLNSLNFNSLPTGIRSLPRV